MERHAPRDDIRSGHRVITQKGIDPIAVNDAFLIRPPGISNCITFRFTKSPDCMLASFALRLFNMQNGSSALSAAVRNAYGDVCLSAGRKIGRKILLLILRPVHHPHWFFRAAYAFMHKEGTARIIRTVHPCIFSLCPAGRSPLFPAQAPAGFPFFIDSTAAHGALIPLRAIPQPLVPYLSPMPHAKLLTTVISTLPPRTEMRISSATRRSTERS